jgi:hypothetical protein
MITETIEIPKDWLRALIKKAEHVNQTQENREAWIANLLGYIESANSLIV